MRDFRSLKVWEKSHQLTLEIYIAVREFPAGERFGLISQMQRSASSIPTNIAEGCGRGSENELRQFMQIGMGSASELEYQLMLARDLEYLPSDQYKKLDTLTVEVKRMLASFIKRLRS